LSAPSAAGFWFSAFCIALMPTSIGYQDLASLIARDRSTPTSWHLIASPLGTVQAATFSYTRPIGTAIPEPLSFEDVNYDPRTLDAYAWKIDEPLTAAHARQIEYPTVNRTGKADRLSPKQVAPAPSAPVNLPQLRPISAPAAAPAAAPIEPPAAVPQPLPTQQHTQASDAAPLVVQTEIHRDVSSAMAPANLAPANLAPAILAPAILAPAMAPAADDGDDDLVLHDRPPDDAVTFAGDDAQSSAVEMSFLDDSAGDHSAAIYFGTGTLGSREGLKSWAPGAAPILSLPSEDSGIKLSALEGADYSVAGSSADAGGESIAGKDDTSRLESPAQRLGLQGDGRAHAEKCLSEAIYFEARGEPYQGQEAVAQVVMNRVFSGYYPHDVCGVVFQNKNRHLACQFTFACEGKDLSRIDEPDMWEQAKQIAKDELDGKIWLADIGHATHYHAYWVHPSWVHEMVRLYRLGVHTFYRPRAWGDDEPTWSPAAVKAEAPVGKPQAATATPAGPAAPAPSSNAAAKIPQAAASPANGTSVQTAKL
jgi:hypothetical protein